MPTLFIYTFQLFITSLNYDVETIIKTMHLCYAKEKKIVNTFQRIFHQFVDAKKI